MSLLDKLKNRSENKCELCASSNTLVIYNLSISAEATIDNSILVCEICLLHIENQDLNDGNYWRCLNESMWSQFAPVKAMVWRLLKRIESDGWPEDLLAMMYLDNNELALAQPSQVKENSVNSIIHKDVNGVTLEAGDSVVLIKDLKVKGTSMVAKQGTAVRRIALDHSNEKYIEGRVNGQQIVIITDYVKRI